MNRQRVSEPGRQIVCVEEVLEYSSEDNPWVKLYYDRVRFPNGDKGRYNRIVEGEKGKGVVVLPVASNGKVALIHIYRYPVHGWQWELPRGFSDPSMTAQENARRELQEETGIIAGELVHLGSIFHGCENVLVLEVWIRLENLLLGIAGRKKISDQRDPNPRTPNTGFAKTDIRSKTTIKEVMPSSRSPSNHHL